jgi:quinoprotein glucose dehydrogenase
MVPGNVGGVNWGGTAIDPMTGILYANTNREAFSARLIPRYGREHITSILLDYLDDSHNWLFAALALYLLGCLLRRRLRPGDHVRNAVIALLVIAIFVRYSSRILPNSKPAHMPVLAHFGFELSEQRKSPYLIERHPIVDTHGVSCTPAPWGGITAVNLNTLAKVWEKPLGSLIPGQNTGILNFGGPIVTAGGLVFTGATDDPYFRIFDASSGGLLREIPLPAPGVATPMTYTLDGRQYVVIAAGGHGDGYSKLGDALISNPFLVTLP